MQAERGFRQAEHGGGCTRKGDERMGAQNCAEEGVASGAAQGERTEHEQCRSGRRKEYEPFGAVGNAPAQGGGDEEHEQERKVAGAGVSDPAVGGPADGDAPQVPLHGAGPGIGDLGEDVEEVHICSEVINSASH